MKDYGDRSIHLASGAEDVIRARDPHLGKVVEIVYCAQASLLSCSFVGGMSTQ
jgi:hypothetical protein